MGKHQTIKDVLLIFLSAAFSLAVIEGFLMWRPYLQAQLPFWKQVSCSDPARDGRVHAHAQFGWTAVPYSAFFVLRSEADGWTVYINNAYGFRDLYNSGDKHAIVLGDSFTEGVNANNDEAFPHLLDLWNPDRGFHNFGMGGYGTANSLAVYRAVASRTPHDLVILAYFLGNDLRDNLSRRGRPVSPDKSEGWYERLQEANSTLRQYWRTYNLLYKALRPQFGRSELSEAEIREGVELTDELLSALVTEVRSNEADLLLVALPSWNQMKAYLEPNEEEQQRLLLQKHADERDNVYLLDVSPEFDRAGVDPFYGIKDKHFSPLGYYTTARLVHDWINIEWPRGHRTARLAPAFQPRDTEVEPDCTSITDYREAFANPTAQPSQLTAEGEAPLGGR